MYDLIIVGGGPAGLTAGIYSARYRLNTLIIAEILGGTALEASMIENYPGFKFIKGLDLIQKMAEQVRALGVPIKEAKITRINKEDGCFRLFSDTEEFEAKRIILALGTIRRKLSIPDEDRFMGRGVSYCVHCDAPIFRNKIVGVIGGRNAAVMAALLLGDYATKVYLIYRREKLNSEPMWTERVLKHDKIEVIYNANVVELKGDNFLTGIKLDNGVELDMQGLFVEIGATPTNILAEELGLSLDEKGYIHVDANNATNVEGVFAAGDCTTGSAEFRQITTAVGEGTVAAFSAYKSLQVK